ncbi:MAG: HEAT repeat domain-containing protein [Candidatus Latescibacteria bacterium]|nr:HEAT repeat domain-containing protein [Candidatus Latescibacterota bacterium]
MSAMLLMPRHSTGEGFDQSRERLDQLAQAAAPSDAAAKTFREGRDLIADEKWSKAEEKFNKVIVQYRTSEYVDAAMYWLAFTLKKQGKFNVADAALERLIKTYPKSTWINDARAMRVEMAPRLGKGEIIAEEARSAETDEIKVVALQSLFQANPERAMVFATDILKPDSKAGRRLKEGAITLLGRFGDEVNSQQALAILVNIALHEPDSRLRIKAINQLGRRDWNIIMNEWNEIEISSPSPSPSPSVSLAPPARPILGRGEGAGTGGVAARADENILRVLKDLAMQTDDPEVAGAAMSALSQHETPRARDIMLDLARTASALRVRQQAISWLGQRTGREGSTDADTVITELMKLYKADQDVEIRMQIISALSQKGGYFALDPIMELIRMTDKEITRTKDKMRLKERAISSIGRRGDERAIAALAQVYDTESSEDLKLHILIAFGQSKQPQALKKLMEIAKNDPSLKLRTNAVSVLGQSQDPEAIKFLEEILK